MQPLFKKRTFFLSFSLVGVGTFFPSRHPSELRLEAERNGEEERGEDCSGFVVAPIAINGGKRGSFSNGAKNAGLAQYAASSLSPPFAIAGQQRPRQTQTVVDHIRLNYQGGRETFLKLISIPALLFSPPSISSPLLFPFSFGQCCS